MNNVVSSAGAPGAAGARGARGCRRPGRPGAADSRVHQRDQRRPIRDGLGFGFGLSLRLDGVVLAELAAGLGSCSVVGFTNGGLLRRNCIRDAPLGTEKLQHHVLCDDHAVVDALGGHGVGGLVDGAKEVDGFAKAFGDTGERADALGHEFAGGLRAMP